VYIFWKNIVYILKHLLRLHFGHRLRENRGRQGRVAGWTGGRNPTALVLSVVAPTTQVSSNLIICSYYIKISIIQWSHGSSVSIVSNYGLDDWSLIPGRGKGFFS
jgi:hypothetical protein